MDNQKFIGEARKRVADNFRRRYSVSLEDLEITNVPGYWRDRETKE